MRVTEVCACLLALVLAGVTLRVVLRDSWRRRRVVRARAMGVEGEVRAAGILEDLGFTILGRQVGGSYGLGVDGQRMEVGLRADYVVESQGRRFVAEVKTGAWAPRIETAATRRQLLEYRVAFDVDGVLLVDADARRVRLVEFPLPDTSDPPSRMAWMIAGVLVGALGTVATLAFLQNAR